MSGPQGEGHGPPPDENNKVQPTADKETDTEMQGNDSNDPQQNGKGTEADDSHRARSSTCKPVAANRPRVDFPSERINARIEYMRDHALIGKFIGTWPTERALRSWIHSKWHPKGHISLHLGAKGFFTAVFNYLEDRNRILDGGPYFFNSAGLFLKGWVERFNPDKEDLRNAPVWIRLYSLPWEYWQEETLQEIGNSIREFVKIAEETKLCRYTSYARICVYMDLKQPLPYSISLFHEDSEWIQVLDYEHVPFRCRKCHEIGHLFRDCPQNKIPLSPENAETHTADGFTKVKSRRRGNRKAPGNAKTQPNNKTKPMTSNRFDILNAEEEQNPEGEKKQEKGRIPEQTGEASGQKGQTIQKQTISQHPDALQPILNQEMDFEYTKSNEKASQEQENQPQVSQNMEEDSENLDIGYLDILGLEQACKTGNFEKIPETQVDNLVAVLSQAQKKYTLGVQTGSAWDGKFQHKDNKKRGRKTTLERTIKIGKILVDSGRYAKLTKYFNPHRSQ